MKRRLASVYDVALTLVVIICISPLVLGLIALYLLEGVRRQLVAAWRGQL
jgi:hypothetical protein